MIGLLAKSSGPHLPELPRRCQTYNSQQINFDVGNHYSFYKVRQSFVMNQQAAVPQKTRSEQETENEANRLKAQVEAALCSSGGAFPRRR